MSKDENTPQMGEPVGGQQKPEDQQKHEDQQKKLEELLATPLSEDEARKLFADQDVRRAQLGIVRQKWTAQITQLQLQVTALDEELLALELDRAVAFRRTLNTPAEVSK